MSSASWLLLHLCVFATPAQPAVTRERLIDQSELLVQNSPGATTSSLRLIFRVGAEQDPPGKAGLAHLVEHLVLQGEMGRATKSLWKDVRAVGGVLNAHTSENATTYELDAPTASFPGLAQRLIAVVTDPPLDRINLSRELGVVKTEDIYTATGRSALRTIISDALYSGARRQVSVIGSELSRDDIANADVIDFYRSYYSTNRLTIAFTGGTSLDAARELVRKNVRLPPAMHSMLPERLLPTPTLPVTEMVRSPAPVAIFGYGLEPSDARLCPAVAALLELRLALALQVRDPVASGVQARCFNEGNTRLLLAIVYGRSTDTMSLPDRVRALVGGAVNQPPSEHEWDLVVAHEKHGQQALLADPVATAEVLSELASEPRPTGEWTDLTVFDPLKLDRAAARRWMNSVFRADRHVALSDSQIGGN